MEIPTYLKDYKDLYQKSPRKANLEWFNTANYGLFIHYGLYSILGKHEWIQYREKIRVKEYEKLKEKFTATNFDAKAIVSLAKSAGMKYINITTRHHESFCLWDTKYTDFNSMNSPAKRDLIQELYDECKNEGIALFLYYSHGIDWRHPHAPSRKYHKIARPRYFPREKSYARGKDHDLNIYLEFMNNQITELLDKFPNVAGIWLDLVSLPYHCGAEIFKVQELYDLIHQKNPHALVSYKHG
jgi:alpha-L-fucosidase